jgi:DNA polymerase III subunit delta'
MAFADVPGSDPSVQLLQRSLQQARLGHAYLFTAHTPAPLESVARTLAKTLNCEGPPHPDPNQPRADSCDHCSSCRRIDADQHPDVLWVRPESKLRVITISQIRDILHAVNLKPAEARWKVTVIVGADRLNVQAANALLKTLEEPPPRSILLLLSTEPQRLLETILSRCLRLNFTSTASQSLSPELQAWITHFAATAAEPQTSLIGRYQLLGQLLQRLAETRESVQQSLTDRSPFTTRGDVDPALKDKWEDELNAVIEAEYRRQRGDVLDTLHWWLRDVWISAHTGQPDFLRLPTLQTHAMTVARRLSTKTALDNLQTWERTRRSLDTTVQEALALEVGLLQLNL